ncbi:MAG: DUF3347 domain-containing protein [Bacteroidetes bacterium]|nr:DUF3347 domain-containing protein [Bacteroidota bacterium]
MKKTILTTAILLLGVAAFAQNTDMLVKNYLSVKNALVLSDDKAVATATTVLQKSITDDKDFGKNTALKRAVNKLADAKTLEKQRAAFYNVSTIIWKEVKNADKVNQPVYYQYCPMADGYWLSTEKNIENPYYGSSMLKCGRVVDTKE